MTSMYKKERGKFVVRLEERTRRADGRTMVAMYHQRNGAWSYDQEIGEKGSYMVTRLIEGNDPNYKFDGYLR